MESKLIKKLLDSIPEDQKERTTNRMLIATKIADAMKAKNMRKIDLIKALGKKNPSEVTRWLSGTHNFTSDLLTDLGRVLDIKLLNVEEENEIDEEFVSLRLTMVCDNAHQIESKYGKNILEKVYPEAQVYYN